MKKSFLFVALSAVLCAAHAGSLAVSVLDKDDKPVPDAVVIVIPSDKSVLPKTPLPMQALIAQEKMQFMPALTLVSVGATLSFINNDSWDHHVRSSPAGIGSFNATNAGFNLLLDGKTEGKPAKPSEVTLDKSRVVGPTLLGCHIHASMRGYIFASDSPWAAKTSAEGIATFEDLPDGAAQVKVWQSEQLIDLAPAQVAIGSTLTKQVMQLTVTPRRRRS